MTIARPLARSLAPSLGGALIALSALAATPAAAQSAPAEKVNQVIIYGDDKCQPSTPDEIVVCNRLPEAERFRVPEIFREDPLDPRNRAWADRVISVERAGRFGTDSCSPIGLGGFTGCTTQVIQNAALERQAATKTDWTALIAEARAKRIAGIDEAAERVEAAVREEERKLAETQARMQAEAAAAEEREARGGAPDPEAAPLPEPPATATPK